MLTNLLKRLIVVVIEGLPSRRGELFCYAKKAVIKIKCVVNLTKFHVRLQRWIQVRSATRFKDCVKTSLGVLNPNLFLGRLFNCC